MGVLGIAPPPTNQILMTSDKGLAIHILISVNPYKYRIFSNLLCILLADIPKL